MAGQPPTGSGDQVMANSQVTNGTEKFEDEWTDILKDRKGDFASRLFQKVSNLFEDISTALERAKAKGPDAETAMISAIEAFLKSDEKNMIDHCILWLLLYRAAEFDPDHAKQSGAAEKVICDVIVSENPYLSFDNLWESKFSFETPGKYRPIQKRCPIFQARGGKWNKKQKELHFQDKFLKLKTTPFHLAAKHGKFTIIERMRTSLEDIDKDHHDSIYEVIKNKVPGKGGEKVLKYAADAEQGSLETMKELLRFPCLNSPEQLADTFEAAVEDGAEIVVNAFLDEPHLRINLVKCHHIKTAMKEMAGATPENKQGYMKIIKRLIALTGPNESLDSEVIESIIELQSIAEDEPKPEQDSKAKPLSWVDIWEATPEGAIKDTSTLLHLAVYHQSLSFVTKFLNHAKYSESATVKKALPRSEKRSGAPVKDEHYPLWYSSKRWKDSTWKERDVSTKSTEIRTQLVLSTIRQTNKMQTLSDIFYQSKQPVRELCFDMSRFNSKLYRVSDFVYSLINHDEHTDLLLYEETIRYAEFPALDLKVDDKETFRDNTYLSERHTEVFDILEWLRTHKRVQRIIDLKVPDRLVNPHEEEDIAKYVAMFEVERLDWRCLDLSLSVFGSDAANDKTKTNANDKTNTSDRIKFNDKIKELHLYSSGRRAVIDHWLGSGGIPTFTKLEDLYIHIVRETVTEKYCEKIKTFIFEGLLEMKQKYSDQLTCNFKLGYETVNSIYWNPTHTVNLDEIAHRITPRLAKFLKSLSNFVPAREKELKNEFRRTRVAIIDNGILSIMHKSYNKIGEVKERKNKDKIEDGASVTSLSIRGNLSFVNGQNTSTGSIEEDQKDENPERNKSLWSRIQDGRSFVYNGTKVSPWLFASDSHGTQMANLICAMDPFCDLYVAKVAEGKYGITPERAAEAIEWALEKKVDIISMSIAMLDPGRDKILEKMVNIAKSKGIIIVCSTHDEGTRTPTAYPAEMMGGEVIVITACDEYGRLLRDHDEKKFHYKLQGQNVAAGAIPFVESSDYISGSSVSTALAAGLSSLILTCDKLAHLRKKSKTVNKENKPEDKNVNQFQYTEGQIKTVTDHLEYMALGNHLLLEKFGKIDSMTKEGDEIYAPKILQKSFQMPI